MDNLFNQFKRTEKTQFKESEYTISNPTHLISVVKALSKFPTALAKISLVDKVSDKHLHKEVDKLSGFLNTKQKAVVLKIVYLEKTDKSKIIDILNTGVIDNPNMNIEMQSIIKYREQALEYATALGVIDDYMNYLESGVYSGPVTKF